MAKLVQDARQTRKLLEVAALNERLQSMAVGRGIPSLHVKAVGAFLGGNALDYFPHESALRNTRIAVPRRQSCEKLRR